MEKTNEKNCLFNGASNRESLYDIEIPENWNGKLIVFIHGYMGFKDWGCWNLVQSFFVNNSFGFVKYNVSHNGGTIEQPIDFPDTEAFSRNTYSKELEDFECIVETLEKRLTDFKLYIIGHSRGGGIAALQAAHPKVAKWVSWAGISSIEKRFPKGADLEKWREETYRYTKNGRTHQQLPHHFNQYLDFESNRERLDIAEHCKQNQKPCLILHGRDDTSVVLEEGERLSEWTKSSLVIIEDAQHTFNASHPWKSATMPNALKEVCQQTLLFFQS